MGTHRGQSKAVVNEWSADELPLKYNRKSPDKSDQKLLIGEAGIRETGPFWVYGS